MEHMIIYFSILPIIQQQESVNEINEQCQEFLEVLKIFEMNNHFEDL